MAVKYLGEDEPDVHDVAPLVRQLGALLHGRGPVIQGAVLADLVSMWLAGHPAFARNETLADWLKAVRELTPINEKMLFGEEGHPQKQQ